MSYNRRYVSIIKLNGRGPKTAFWQSFGEVLKRTFFEVVIVEGTKPENE